ncbi:hypothetical protein BGW80DRAFT_1462675 [Lactifluus volemus]|nr:hypothetical protein BGW80DRAFT_1462675 [Lactifluus volemus]
MSHLLLRQAIADSPELEDTSPLVINEDSTSVILQQLDDLGFIKTQAPSPLEACIEYLVLHVPEVDLPPAFPPENNSSNPLVTGIHGGQEDIKKRWVKDRAIKAGRMARARGS